MARKEATVESPKGGTNEIIGIGLFCLAMLLLLALFSFHKGDLSFNGTEVNDPRHNLIGGAGAWVAQGCFLALGAAAYALPPLLLLFAVASLFQRLQPLVRRWPWALVLLLSCTAVFSLYRGQFQDLAGRLGATDPGGFMGALLDQYVFGYVGTAGATIILLAVYCISFLYLTNFRLTEWVREKLRERKERKRNAGSGIDDEELELAHRAKELEQQYRELQQQVDLAGRSLEESKPSLGADLRPVPEPQVRDLSETQLMPQAAKGEEAEEPVRRLAAIMFTDIAGYTRLSNRDEKAAMKLIKQQRKILKPIVKAHDGEWMKEMGDGLLLCFPSSLSAVTCAIAIQEATRAETHMDLRIGIHQGDIVLDGSDVYGDGVNIASRLEKFAPVGGIAVSEKIQQDVASHPEVNIQLLGEFELDGVNQRVEIYTVTSNLGDTLDETRWIEPEETKEEVPDAGAVPEPKKAKGKATKEDILGEPKSAAAAPPRKLRPKKSKTTTVARAPVIGNYKLPPNEFLQIPEPNKGPSETKEELIANAKVMQQTLAQFGIEVSLGDITKGPTITRYELHPAPGVKLEKIANLSNNITAALRAERINILAPVPGKSSVGIEVPNRHKSLVTLRDLMESDRWRKTKARVPVALGKDVYGKPIIADLAEMPHLLIAGATGAGKSVCVNSIIASLLYRFSPEDLRFVMIDPKVVELQVYNKLPHLVVPVVTDPKKVILALRWVVQEMENRYKIFAKVGVKNIQGFNGRPADNPAPEQDPELPLFGAGEKVGTNSDGFAVEVDEEIVVPREDDVDVPGKLSYIVVVIDELADLMLSAPADVESAIARITQMARAAGIHCIVATQRPSVDVITGVIKANIPARIAFQTASKIDSRTILDEMGAEKLLGKGDMLYLKPTGAQPMRAQGALVTDQEIQGVVDFIAKQGSPAYELEIHNQLKKPTATYETGASGEDEELIQSSIEVIRTEHKASVSLLQRRLRLGYTRAARIMDELEDRGIVGPSKGAEPRDILIDLDVAAEAELAD
jgi:DNA segregation ATPase FtsK/SpoIIIE-like protein